jgi:hypothetical protein
VQTDYDDSILQILAYEFRKDEQKEINSKIKRKLKSSKLGSYDEKRISILRSFKNDIQDEIHKSSKSKFYTHSHGEYSDPNDFNFESLLKHYSDTYQNIHKDVVGSFINYSIYLYYLR